MMNNILSAENAQQHLINKQNFETALNLNAKERSRRFASINTKQRLEQVRKAIHDRSVSLFEPRPELGHGTNTLGHYWPKANNQRIVFRPTCFFKQL